MDILESNEYPDIVSWYSSSPVSGEKVTPRDERANTVGSGPSQGFIIYDKDRFEKEVMSIHFIGCKYSSFTRRLRRWKFQSGRVVKNKKARKYWHPMFQRGNYKLVAMIEAAPQVRKKRKHLDWNKNAGTTTFAMASLQTTQVNNWSINGLQNEFHVPLGPKNTNCITNSSSSSSGGSSSRIEGCPSTSTVVNNPTLRIPSLSDPLIDAHKKAGGSYPHFAAGILMDNFSNGNHSRDSNTADVTHHLRSSNHFQHQQYPSYDSNDGSDERQHQNYFYQYGQPHQNHQSQHYHHIDQNFTPPGWKQNPWISTPVESTSTKKGCISHFTTKSDNHQGSTILCSNTRYYPASQENRMVKNNQLSSVSCRDPKPYHLQESSGIW